MAPQSCARPISSTAGWRWRCTTKSRWSRSSRDWSWNTASSLLYSRDRGRREAQLGAIGRPRQRGHRLPEPRRRAVPGRSLARRDVPRARRERKAAHRVVPRQGPSRPRLSGPIQTAGAGFLLPGADLSRRRRNHAAARRRVHVHVRARARIRSRTRRVDRRSAATSRSSFSCRAGSIPRRSAGIRAIITSMPPDAAITRARPKGCGRKT